VLAGVQKIPCFGAEGNCLPENRLLCLELFMAKNMMELADAVARKSWTLKTKKTKN